MTIEQPKPLRDGLTGFGLRLAAVLEPASPDPAVAVRWAVLTPAAAVEPMRTLLRRRGLEHAQALRQGDGSMRPTWSEMPEIWIRGWTAGDSAIVLLEDVDGPSELRFVIQIATDTVKTVMRIGNTGVVSREIGRAYWDVGIRRYVAEVAARLVPVIATPERVARFAAAGLTMQLIERGDVYEQISTRTERP